MAESTNSITGSAINALREGLSQNSEFSTEWLDKLSQETRDLLIKTLNQRDSGLGGLNNTQRREVSKAILNSHIQRHSDGTGTWIHGPNAGKIVTKGELDRITGQFVKELSIESAADNREWFTNLFVKLGGAIDEVGNYFNDTFTYARDSKGNPIPNATRTGFLTQGEFNLQEDRQTARGIGENIGKAGEAWQELTKPLVPTDGILDGNPENPVEGILDIGQLESPNKLEEQIGYDYQVKDDQITADTRIETTQPESSNQVTPEPKPTSQWVDPPAREDQTEEFKAFLRAYPHLRNSDGKIAYETMQANKHGIIMDALTLEALGP